MATMLDVVQKMISLGLVLPNPDPAKLARDSIFKFGYVVSQAPDGKVLINLDNTAVSATPVTDETIATGQKVATLRADNGTYIILGSART